jgi:hypothetical protein
MEVAFGETEKGIEGQHTRKDNAMKKRMMVIAVMMLQWVAGAEKLPAPVCSVPYDTIFRGELVDTLWCPHDSAYVYFTTDGSAPHTMCAFFTPGYKWVFRFDSTATVKAFSWWRKGSGEVLTSDTISVTYTKKLHIPQNDPWSLFFTDSVFVMLMSPENGSTIFYTLDGSEPDSTSAVYTIRILIKKTTTIKFMATKPKRAPSDIVTRVYEKIQVFVNRHSANNSETNLLDFNVSVRPASNLYLTFSLPQQDFASITINDISGHSIATMVNRQFGKGIHDYSWPIHGIPAGLYLLKMKTSTGNLVKRISLVR